MRVLLNLREKELAQFSGDISFYRNLLAFQTDGLHFHLVNRRQWVLREARKVFERANQKIWPRGVRRLLLKVSRKSYIHPSNLNGVDVILSHILFPIVQGHDTPIIWSSQGISPPFYYDAAGPFTQEDVVDLYNDFGNRADLLLIWTRSGANTVKNLCSLRTPIAVLPPVMDVQPLDKDRRTLPPKLARCQLLFVGRHPERKGLTDLIAAYRQVLARGADIALDVVSQVPASQERDLRLIKGVTYYKDISDALVAELMERADVLVLPTYAETYGFVLIEAMARGCALISSDYEPLNELVVDGENGFVVTPGDVEALTRTLVLLAEQPDLVRRFSEAGLLRYRQEFAPEKLFPRYVTMFEDVRRACVKK